MQWLNSVPTSQSDRLLGTRATIDLRIMDLSTHAPLSMPIQVIHGKKPGPTLFVCAALHGDEVNGVEIIRRLTQLSALKRIKGTLLAAPIVNVFGFLAHARYLPDRRDLNRSFPGSPQGSLAGRLAHLFLEEVVARSTHGIDIHTGAVHRTNFPQIRADLDDEETFNLARIFGVPIVINAGLRAGSLREQAGQHGVRVLVYEAGEALRFDETCIRAGLKGIVRVMRSLGMLPPSKRTQKLNEPIIIRNSRWERAPMSGVFRAILSPGADVRLGDHLGIISDPFGDTEMTVTSRSDGVIVGRTMLPVVNEGDALFHIGIYEGIKASADALDAFEPDDDYDTGATAEIAAEPPIV
ncbi:MAG: M14 family metallopeptidase [Proteobacteria bacterium]|nr:M14 family metallopeptidase [Pseudomonadota bacterium]